MKPSDKFLSKIFRCNAFFMTAAMMLGMSSAHALVYEGVNGSGQSMQIDYGNTGVAKISMAAGRHIPAPINEVWQAGPVLNGFVMTAPVDSSLKKEGVRVEYVRVNNSSNLLTCKAGCGSTVPYMIAVKR